MLAGNLKNPPTGTVGASTASAYTVGPVDTLGLGGADSTPSHSQMQQPGWHQHAGVALSCFQAQMLPNSSRAAPVARHGGSLLVCRLQRAVAVRVRGSWAHRDQRTMLCCSSGACGPAWRISAMPACDACCCCAGAGQLRAQIPEDHVVQPQQDLWPSVEVEQPEPPPSSRASSFAQTAFSRGSLQSEG